jgi:hypothetical protein
MQIYFSVILLINLLIATLSIKTPLKLCSVSRLSKNILADVLAANDESTDKYQSMTEKKILRTFLSNPEYESFHDNNFLLH